MRTAIHKRATANLFSSLFVLLLIFASYSVNRPRTFRSRKNRRTEKSNIESIQSISSESFATSFSSFYNDFYQNPEFIYTQDGKTCKLISYLASFDHIAIYQKNTLRKINNFYCYKIIPPWNPAPCHS